MSSPVDRNAPSGTHGFRRAGSENGLAIAFDLYRAPGPTGIVVVPGFWRTRDYPGIRAIASRFLEMPAPCAIMDCRGHGDSEGTFEFDRNEHLDVAAVTRAFVSELGLGGVVLFGLSAGAAIAISSMAVDPALPVRGLILVSPVASFPHVIPRPNPFTIHRHLSLAQARRPPRFRWPGRDRRSPLSDAGAITVPVCLIHARHDWLVSHHHAEWLARQLADRELHVLDVPGRYHADRLIDVAGERVWPIVTSFFRERCFS